MPPVLAEVGSLIKRAVAGGVTVAEDQVVDVARPAAPVSARVVGQPLFSRRGVGLLEPRHELPTGRVGVEEVIGVGAVYIAIEISVVMGASAMVQPVVLEDRDVIARRFGRPSSTVLPHSEHTLLCSG